MQLKIVREKGYVAFAKRRTDLEGRDNLAAFSPSLVGVV
jgi:hypothetical protein